MFKKSRPTRPSVLGMVLGAAVWYTFILDRSGDTYGSAALSARAAAALRQLQDACNETRVCDVARLPASARVAPGSPWRFMATEAVVHHHFPAAATCEGQLWIVNGFHGIFTPPTVNIFDPASQLWYDSKPIRPVDPAATQSEIIATENIGVHGAAVYVRPYLYVMGGLRRATVLSRVFRYNVVEHNERKTVEWEAVANMPTARSGLACAAIDTLVYCAHGRLSNRANDYTNKLEVFDTVSQSWSSDYPTNPAGGRDHPTVAVVDTKIYFLGGLAARKAGHGVLNGDEVDMYDTATRTWHVREALPGKSSSGHAVVVGGSIFYFGGLWMNERGGSFAGMDVVWRYDSSVDAWDCFQPMPIPIGGGAAILHEDRVFVMLGGEFSGRTSGFGVVVSLPQLQRIDCPVYEQALVLHHRAGEFPAKQVVKSELTTWYRGSHALPEVASGDEELAKLVQEVELEEGFRSFNRVTQLAFSRCVHGFRNNALTERERKCIKTTAGKMLRFTDRMNVRFSEAQLRMAELAKAEAAK